jgi:hypothetical protein
VSRVTGMRRMFTDAHSFRQKLCGAAWVNSKASKVDMFTNSPGFIPKTECVFSAQSRDELKRAVDDCEQLTKADNVSKKQKQLQRFL